MKSDNVIQLPSPDGGENTRSVLDEIVREGARRMLQAALGIEVDEYIAQFANVVDSAGHRVVVRNGHLPERELVTGAGPVMIRQPRVIRDYPKRSWPQPLLRLSTIQTGCGF